MLSNILDRISFYSLFIVVILLPIFFLPFTRIPIEISKGLLLIIGLSVSIIFWTAARFSDGKIILPKSWLLVSGFGIVLAFLISALFSPVLKISFFGTMLDVGTFYFMLACFLLMFLSSVILKDLKNAKKIMWAGIISSAAVLVFQAARLFIPNVLSFGILGINTDNILGSWNGLGIFASFSVILSLFIIEFFSISKIKKIMLGILMLLALIFVAIINFPAIWGILGVFALIIFVYKVSFSLNLKEGENKRNFPMIPFAVVMISILFLMTGQLISGFLTNHLKISTFEVRPSFSATMSVARATLIKNPTLGSGPNRFTEMWALYKPAAINISRYWDSSFDQGSGLLPTFAITTGALGILAWLVFIVFLLLAGAKSFFSPQRKSLSNMETVVFFIMSLYLFVSSFFYSVGPAIFLLAFIFLGIFIGLSTNETKKEIKISLLDDPRKSFFSILLLVLIMIVSASAGFKYIERFISVPYFQNTFSAQNIDGAEYSINKTLSFYSNDLYLRTYTQVYLLKLNSLISKGSLSDSDKADLKSSFDEAMNGGQLAENYDQTNFLNYESLGSVYDAGASLGVSGAYDKAIETYKKASSLNPLNPGIRLVLARLAFRNGDMQSAKDYANESLSLKQDYPDAFVILSQIAKSQNNIPDALSYAETALSISPADQNLAQYISFLKNENISPTPSVVSSVPNSKDEVKKEGTKKK